MTKERLLSFAEYAKDAQPEVLVTLTQTIVERIYIVDKDDERYCHIFIKGCSGEDYTGFFWTTSYIEDNSLSMCDSEQRCIVYIIAYAPALSKRQGRGVLFDPVMPYSVVSCRICTFYIKFHKAEPFKPYSVPFDVFYSNLKYSRTILTRSVKNRLSCRQAGGRPGLILRRP